MANRRSRIVKRRDDELVRVIHVERTGRLILQSRAPVLAHLRRSLFLSHDHWASEAQQVRAAGVYAVQPDTVLHCQGLPLTCTCSQSTSGRCSLAYCYMCSTAGGMYTPPLVQHDTTLRHGVTGKVSSVAPWDTSRRTVAQVSGDAVEPAGTFRRSTRETPWQPPRTPLTPRALPVEASAGGGSPWSADAERRRSCGNTGGGGRSRQPIRRETGRRRLSVPPPQNLSPGSVVPNTGWHRYRDQLMQSPHVQPLRG